MSKWDGKIFFLLLLLNTVFCTEALHKEKKKLIMVLNVQNAMSTKSPMLISTSN